ncbi:MAG: CBS domain-containing protein [bacterium]
MEIKRVKDIMVPLDEYALVSQDATLLDALMALEQAQENLAGGKHPHRAVLIVDENKNIVGKIGHLGFLKALEPKYGALGDISILNKAGISSEFIESMMENFQFFHEDLSVIYKKARMVSVMDVMRPVTEIIDEKACLPEAIHKMVMLQTLSILVKRGPEVTGVLRLSDLFDEVKKEIKDVMM